VYRIIMTKETRAYELFRPLTILSVVAAIMLFVGGLTMAYTVDNSAKAREQQLIANGIAGSILEIYNQLVPQTTWDDALGHLQDRDVAWAENNVGQYLYDTGNFQYSFVLDENNRLFYAAEMGKSAPLNLYTRFASGMHKSINAIRQKEAYRRKRGVTLGSLTQPVQGHNIIRAQGKVYIVVASLVQPDFGTVKQRHATAPVVIAATPIDDNFLAHFGERYLQPDIKLRQVQMEDMSQIGQVDINDDKGHYIATLQWSPGKPGSNLAANLALPVLAVIGLFFGVLVILYQRSFRAAQELIASEARIAPRLSRSVDRPAQSRDVFRSSRRRARSGPAFGHIRCSALPRSRSLQGSERHLWPPDGRRADRRRSQAYCRGMPPVRHLRAAIGRRIRDRADRCLADCRRPASRAYRQGDVRAD
jgi:sensor domain CHASE-containing protein